MEDRMAVEFLAVSFRFPTWMPIPVTPAAVQLTLFGVTDVHPGPAVTTSPWSSTMRRVPSSETLTSLAFPEAAMNRRKELTILTLPAA